MNLKIKFRESFRPFAPAVLQERAPEWFDLKPGQESPYMLLVAPVLEHRRVPVDAEMLRTMQHDPDLRRRVNVVRSEIPAVTHVDFSARLQTVDVERNPRFYRLLDAFDRLTGCPVLVNTSFNVRGEPIVCTPEDAYRCFLATGHGCTGHGRHRDRQGRGDARSRSGSPRSLPGTVSARLTRTCHQGKAGDHGSILHRTRRGGQCIGPTFRLILRGRPCASSPGCAWSSSGGWLFGRPWFEAILDWR